MERVIDYLAMGGYAAYVWPALAIASGVMIFIAGWSIVQLQAGRRRLAELEPVVERRRQQRRARKSSANMQMSDGPTDAST